MSQESKGIQVILSFTKKEIELLQKYSGEMEENTELFNRINGLKGDSDLSIKSVELEYLEQVIGDLKTETPDEKIVANGLYSKIIESM